MRANKQAQEPYKLVALAGAIGILFTSQSTRTARAGDFLANILGYTDKGLKVVSGAKDAKPFADYVARKRQEPSYVGTNAEIRAAAESGGKTLCNAGSFIGCAAAPKIERVGQGLARRQRDMNEGIEAVFANDSAAIAKMDARMDKTSAEMDELVYGNTRDPSLDMALSAGAHAKGAVGKIVSSIGSIVNLMQRPNVGSAASEPKSAREAAFVRPSNQLGTNRDAPCIDFNRPGDSVCPEDETKPKEADVPSSNFDGKWAEEGGTCSRPVTISRSGIAGYSASGMLGGCSGSDIKPIQYPHRWSYAISCASGVGMEVRLNELDANHLRLAICYMGQCGQPDVLSRCR